MAFVVSRKAAGRLVAAVALASFIVMSYQNCGKAGFEDQTTSLDTSSTESIDPKLANLPFPYDVGVNQIAYMSCEFPVQVTSSDTYFTFKVGAFDNSIGMSTNPLAIYPAGMSLRQDFKDAFNQAAMAYNPNFRSTKLGEALRLLPSVAGMQLQLSLRDQQTPQTTLMRTPVPGFSWSAPIKNLFEPLGSSAVVDTFKKHIELPQNFVHYVPTVQSAEERSLEGSVLAPFGGYANGTNFHTSLQDKLSANYLTVGFGNGDKLSGPAGNFARAYAMGYRPAMTTARLSFPNNKGLPQINNSFKAMIGLTEIDLRTGSQGRAWTCGDNADYWSFKIVRTADRNKLIYRKNNFNKVSGQCPGKTTAQFTGIYPEKYCPSPDNPEFGLPLSFFPGPTAGSFLCPTNRRGLVAGQATSGDFSATATGCMEKYSPVCPPEPFFPVTRDASKYEPQYWDDSLAGSPEKLALLAALRRFLPESKWDINISRRCIVEKAGVASACYVGQPIYDEYFFASTLTAGRDVYSTEIPGYERYSGCGAGQQCGAYMSLCVRK